MLMVQNLSVAPGKKKVLKDISFRLPAGSVTAVVGPNGSGKTTLLRSLSGDLPWSGDIRLNGTDLRDLSAADLATRRAVLSQSSSMAFAFTVEEVVSFGLIAPAPPGRVAEALAGVGLAGYGPRVLQELSGGEQARVHLARALVQVWTPVGPEGPRWLLLDEPVAALDIAHQLTVMRIARRYADAGGAVLAVMHDLNLTAMFSDRVLLLQEGRLIADDTPEQVLSDHPLSCAYGCALRVKTAPAAGAWILPQAAG